MRTECNHSTEPPGTFVKFPEGVRERVKELAVKWCREAPMDLLEARRRDPAGKGAYDRRIAERLAERLASQYEYTLDLSDADEDRDGIDDFLFHMKKGHCEYFASALTAMCCILDVRARLATGFHSRLQAGDEVLVRSRNAHAWTEVYTPETDWIIMDATPPGALDPPAGWWAGTKDFWSELRFLWYEKVLGYNSTSRWELAAWTRRQAHGLWQSIRALGASLKQGIMNLLLHGKVDMAILWILGAVATAATVVWTALLVRAVRRRMAPLQALGPNRKLAYRQLAFVRKLFALLRRRGVTLRDTWTPRETALAAAEQLHLGPRAASES